MPAHFHITLSLTSVALLTFRIRGLNEHILVNKKDVTNRAAMRQMIMARARHLKYIKRKWPERYEQTLLDIGVDARTVEGELKTGL